MRYIVLDTKAEGNEIVTNCHGLKLEDAKLRKIFDIIKRGKTFKVPKWHHEKSR